MAAALDALVELMHLVDLVEDQVVVVQHRIADFLEQLVKVMLEGRAVLLTAVVVAVAALVQQVLTVILG